MTSASVDRKNDDNTGVFMFLPALSVCLVLASSPVHPNDSTHAAIKSKLHCQIPRLDFQEPPHNANKQVAFTFDDGPDGKSGMTDALLDELQRLHIQATFFVCGDNWTHVESDPIAKDTLRRIVAQGHEIGNHTSHHPHLPSLHPAEVLAEFSSTQDTLLSESVLGAHHGAITLLRAPFGQPYESDAVNEAWVGPIVAQLGVHIGWNINSYDWACRDKMCVVDNVMRAIDAGEQGAILMHSNYQATVDAMPILASTLRHRGYHFVTVEQLLKQKYGASSAELHSRYMENCSVHP